jgi:hypothetical protein
MDGYEDVSLIAISAFVGGMVSYLGAVLKNWLDLRQRVDQALRRKRESLYASLWTVLAKYPDWSDDATEKYNSLEDFSKEITKWYDNAGGMYLSRSATAAVFRLQRVLREIRSKNINSGLDTTLSPKDNKSIKKRCVKLRKGLTRDLLSRRAAPMLP